MGSAAERFSLPTIEQTSDRPLASRRFFRFGWLPKQRQVLRKSLFSHFFQWNKLQGRRVHTIAQITRRRPIIEEVSEVGIAFLGAQFRAHHVVALIHALRNMLRRDRLGEAGPAGTAIELIFR